MTILFEEDSALPLLHGSIVFRTGAAADPEGKEGTTRLLLRLLRRTAAGRSADDNQMLLDTVGASAHAEVSRTHSALGGTAISRSTSELLQFLKDAFLRPRLDAEQLEKIRREALAEAVDALDDDSGLARRFFARNFSSGHPLSKPPSGTQQSLRAITLSDITQRHEQLKRSPLLFAFAGDIKLTGRSQLTKWADELRKSANDGSSEPNPAGTSYSEPPGPVSNQLVFVDKPDRTQTQIVMGCLGTHPSDADHIALYLGHMIFGGTFTSRLSQEVRGKRGWSYGAYSSLPIGNTRQAFSLWMFPAKEHAADCIELTRSLLAKLIDKGVSEKELASTKRFVKNSHAFSVDTAEKRLAQATDRALYGLPADYHESFGERVRRTTREEVNSALRSRLRLDNFLTTLVGTADDLLENVTRAAGAERVTQVAYDSQD